MDKLINWSALSLIVSGKHDTLRTNKIPKKYKEKVNRLFEVLELWNNNEDIISLKKHNKLKEDLINLINKN